MVLLVILNGLLIKVHFTYFSRPITTLSDHELLQNVNCMDDEWVFMWSTTPLMPTYWATCRALIDRADVYGDGEVFSYFDGEVMTTYMQKVRLINLRGMVKNI